LRRVDLRVRGQCRHRSLPLCCTSRPSGRRGDGRRAKANASSESSARATERGAVRLLAFLVKRSPLGQEPFRLASVMFAADKLSIGGQWLLRRVAPSWSAKNTRGNPIGRPLPGYRLGVLFQHRHIGCFGCCCAAFGPTFFRPGMLLGTIVLPPIRAA